jgi:putative ABC transport system permease protein
MGWTNRLANLFRGDRLDDEIDEELRFHIESRIAENVAGGMTADEARRDAMRRFGSAPALREHTRDADIVLLLDHLRQDLSFAARSLRKRPAFALVALLTLALGIGATAAIFTVVRSVLLRPLPFPDPDAIQIVSHMAPAPRVWLYPGMGDAEYVEFRRVNRSFESLATFTRSQMTLTGAGEAARLTGATVTADFFRVLRVNAALGRTFAAADEQIGGDKIVLLGDSLWRSRFGGDPAIVERTIDLDGVRYRVAGVLPAGFSYPAGAAFWTPLGVRITPNLGYIRPVIGRLRPAVTRQQAQSELDAWVRALPADPRDARDAVARVTPLHDAMVGDVRLPLWIFGAAVAVLLLIACANVANLLLMRAVSRRQEIATRLALGAARGRLVRQFLTEGALLSVAGGAAGVALAVTAGPPLLALLPEGRLPQDVSVRMDLWVVAFTAGVSLLTGVIVGLAPIVQTTRHGQYGALREGAAAATRQSHLLRHALVVAEVALTVVLLVGAGLLVRSFIGLRSVPLGIAPDRAMAMTIDLPDSRYRTADEMAGFHQRLLRSIAALPDVTAAGLVNWLPLGDMVIWGDVQAEDRQDLAGEYNATKVAVSAGYFNAMGIRLIKGRAFTDRDDARGERVLIVSEAVARTFWPGGDPLGKRMALVERPRPSDWLTVVGVVEDVRQGGFKTRPAHAVYQPYGQVSNRFFLSRATFVARTNAPPRQAAAAMRAALQQTDPAQAPQALESMEALIDRTVAEPKFQTRLLGGFSLIALLLAALGVYGVMAASVMERRFEIGVRMALGADRTSVIGLVLRRTLVLMTIGIAIGLAGAYAVTGLLKTLLFGVTPRDAMTFAMAIGVMLAAALAAAVLPARRASSVDPVMVLRRP